MKTIEAIYEDGKIIPIKGNVNIKKSRVIVIFLDDTDMANMSENDNSKENLSFEEFDNKWGGILEDTDINCWKDEYIKDKENKHK
jgi:hypothetical protein